MCEAAPEIIKWLDEIGTVFSRDKDGKVALRAFGGQSRNRTVYAGASTGKQIMSALIRETRKFECQNIITRKLGTQFHSALMKDNKCYGALLYNEHTRRIRWECSCSQAMCGGCAMVINGIPALACATFVDEIKGGELILEPLSKFPVVADLIVNRNIIYDNLLVQVVRRLCHAKVFVLQK